MNFLTICNVCLRQLDNDPRSYSLTAASVHSVPLRPYLQSQSVDSNSLRWCCWRSLDTNWRRTNVRFCRSPFSTSNTSLIWLHHHQTMSIYLIKNWNSPLLLHLINIALCLLSTIWSDADRILDSFHSNWTISMQLHSNNCNFCSCSESRRL